MRPVSSLAAMVALNVLFVGAAQAQAVVVDQKWPSTIYSRALYIHSNLPVDCDQPTLRAATTWNNVGARFQHTWGSNPITAYRRSEQTLNQDLSSLTIEDGYLPANVHMQTQVVSQSSVIKDADVTVNTSEIFYANGNSAGLFYCSPLASGLAPSNRYDYQTAVGHELGHAVGMHSRYETGEYVGNYRCIMYGYMGSGDNRRTVCNEEYSAFRSAYGTR